MKGIIMKKIFLILALVVAMSFDMSAQRSDGFFKSNGDDWGNRMSDPNDIGVIMPGGLLGSTENDPAAPIGSGLLILTALGGGYLVAKKKKK